MEEKKQIKISIMTLIFFIIAIIVIIGIVIFCFNTFFNRTKIISNTNKNNSLITSNTNTTMYENISNISSNSNNIIDEKISKIDSHSDNEIKCEMKTGSSKKSLAKVAENFYHVENAFISSYEELEDFITQYESITIEDEDVLDVFDNEYFNNHTLAIEAHDSTSTNNNYKIDNIVLNGSEVDINITNTHYTYGGVLEPRFDFTFIILDKDITNANFNVTTKTINNDWDAGISFKPIIYLYPTKDTKVSVKLQYEDNITVSYPKYSNGWNVLAKKDGSLINLGTNKNLYALYYESKNIIDFKIENDGFVVKGENSSEFLEEKLAKLGLTEREAEEFIIYWLPKLEANKYNYIRFATSDEINKNIPLMINPNPDTTIRVLMTYKGIDNPIDVKEQQLVTPERNGFVAVEWGGTEIQ